MSESEKKTTKAMSREEFAEAMAAAKAIGAEKNAIRKDRIIHAQQQTRLVVARHTGVGRAAAPVVES